MTRYISTKEYDYFCGGVYYEEVAAREKQTRKKQKILFHCPSLFLRSVLSMAYAPEEVIIFLSADIPQNRRGASLLCEAYCQGFLLIKRDSTLSGMKSST